MGQRRNISGIDLAAGVGSIRRAYLAADGTGIVSSTAVNVTGLFVPMEANSIYIYTSFIVYSAGTAGDLAFSHSIPSGAGLSYGDATTNFFGSNTAADNWSGTGSSTKLSFMLAGYVTTAATAGNLQARAAQQVTDAANATTIRFGSWMKLERVA
jgi:hypothetical protein